MHIDKRIFGDLNENVATRLINLAHCYREVGDYETALEKIKEAYKIDNYNYGEEHPMLCYTIAQEAALYMKMGNFNDSLSLRLKVLEINSKINNGINDKVSKDLSSIAICYYRIGNIDLAKNYFIKAISIDNQLYEFSDLRRLDNLYSYVKFCAKELFIDEGKGSFQLMKEIVKASNNSSHEYLTEITQEFPDIFN